MSDNKPYGPLTSDIERKDLKEAHALLLVEIETAVKLVGKGMAHLVTCDSPEHRAQVAQSTATLIGALSEMQRMLGWMEERLVPGVIEGTSTLAAIKADIARVEAMKASPGVQQKIRLPADQANRPVEEIVAEEKAAQTTAEQVEDFDPALAARVTNVGSGTKQ